MAQFKHGNRNLWSASQGSPHRHFDPNVLVAWMYFRDEMSQQEIAEILGISRSSVSNYLSAARTKGIYSINFNAQVIGDVELSKRLKQRFGLAEAFIVPSHGSYENLRKRIGSAGALYLTQAMAQAQTLGVCWGETVLEVGDALTPEASRVREIYQMVGIARTDFWALAEACNIRIASKLDANVFQFPAPGRVSSELLYQMLIKERIVAEQFTALRKLDAAIFGICSLEPDSLILSSGLMQSEMLDAARRDGGVGIIGGRVFDVAGKPVQIAGYDELLLALSLDEVRSIPVRIAVAGGEKKHRAIFGALQGGLVTALITDVQTAEAVLDLKV